jgi:hypothetical protein
MFEKKMNILSENFSAGKGMATIGSCTEIMTMSIVVGSRQNRVT